MANGKHGFGLVHTRSDLSPKDSAWVMSEFALMPNSSFLGLTENGRLIAAVSYSRERPNSLEKEPCVIDRLIARPNTNFVKSFKMSPPLFLIGHLRKNGFKIFKFRNLSPTGKPMYARSLSRGLISECPDKAFTFTSKAKALLRKITP